MSHPLKQVDCCRCDEECPIHHSARPRPTALAPELLEIAKDFAEYLEFSGDKGLTYERVLRIIAKAEGKS